jgi:hypothetical protein
LHIRHKEDEPIEAAQTAPRGSERRVFGLFMRRWRRRARAAALPILGVAEMG